MLAERQRWREQQAGWPGARLMFLDESAAQTNLCRRYGRGPRGERVKGVAPRNWQTTTMLSTLSARGPVASMVVEGATDTAVFTAYVTQVLLPQLRPGDWLIMDHLSVHHAPSIAALLAAAGINVSFLPAYSPDFNPIEPMWSKIKALLRRYQARTLRQLHRAIAAALEAVTPADAAAWFTHCGYTVPPN